MNAHLVNLLHQLAVLAEKNDEFYRATAFYNAAKIITDLKYALNKTTINKFLSKKYDGVGDGIEKRISEYVETGTIKEISDKFIDDDSTHNKNDQSLHQLLGVGPSTIKEWNKLGVHTMVDLRSKIKNGEITLTHTQMCGLKYFADLNKKIPREDVKLIAARILSCVLQINPSLTHYCIVGSYRRGSITSGDVDLLITTNDPISNVVLAKIISAEKEFVCMMSCGSTRITFLWKHKHVVQVDILITPTNEYFAALNYFTGSQKHNIALRSAAKSAGMKLNQTGLFLSSGKSIPLNSEEDIYKKIGIPYIEPQDR